MKISKTATIYVWCNHCAHANEADKDATRCMICLRKILSDGNYQLPAPWGYRKKSTKVGN
jgi:hypothetical protein